MKRKLNLIVLTILCLASLPANSFAADQNLEIITFQPVYEYLSWQEGGDEGIETLPDGIPNQAELAPAAARYITSKIPDTEYTVASKDLPITKENIQSLGPNQIVIWQSHGNWDEENEHIVIQTGADYDDEKYATDPDYKADVDNGRIVKIDTYYEGITAAYFEEYLGDLTGSFIFLGQCDSAHDGSDELASVFLRKGASAVIANSKTIRMTYGNVMQYTVTKLLADINPDTKGYYTLGDALTKAKSIYGASDHDRYPGSLGAELLLFGDANYHLANIPTPPEEEEEEQEIVNPDTADEVYCYTATLLISLISLAVIIRKK